MNVRTKDGTWISSGLSADFRVLYKHPYANVYKVRTAAGDYYAHADQLTWEPCSFDSSILEPNENKTTT